MNRRRLFEKTLQIAIPGICAVGMCSSFCKSFCSCFMRNRHDFHYRGTRPADKYGLELYLTRFTDLIDMYPATMKGCLNMHSGEVFRRRFGCSCR